MRVHVVDLATGRRSTDCQAFSAENYGELSGDSLTFDQVTLRPDGSLALDDHAPAGTGPSAGRKRPRRRPAADWHAQPEHGCTGFTVSDTAEPGSMAVNDSLLYWMDAGETIGHYLVVSKRLLGLNPGRSGAAIIGDPGRAAGKEGPAWGCACGPSALPEVEARLSQLGHRFEVTSAAAG